MLGEAMKQQQLFTVIDGTVRIGFVCVAGVKVVVTSCPSSEASRHTEGLRVVGVCQLGWTCESNVHPGKRRNHCLQTVPNRVVCVNLVGLVKATSIRGSGTTLVNPQGTREPEPM